MNVLLRYDDYSELSNADVDLAVIETVAAQGFKILVGVIPAIADVNWELGHSIPLRKLSPERIRLLKRFVPKHVEIALHGYTHQAVTRLSGLFEFGDLVDFKRQVERIRDGKNFLEDSFGAPVKWFIPPWNAYGLTTLQAVKECGLAGISADASFGPLDDDLGLSFAPASCLLREIPLAVACAKDEDSAVIAVLHDYDFKESGIGDKVIAMTDFRTILSGLVSSSIRIGSFSGLVEAGVWSAARARANQGLRKYTAGPIRYFMHPGTGSIYWSEVVARKKMERFESISGSFKSILSGYRRVMPFRKN